MPFKTWKGQKPFIFLPWSLFLSKSFDHITKDANILHLKSGDSYRLNYFPPFPPNQNKHNNPLFNKIKIKQPSLQNYEMV
jgi:hypothetical protein